MNTTTESPLTAEELTPPADLSGRARDLFLATVPSQCKGRQRLALITEALRSLDLADRCREQVAKDGLTMITARSGVAHCHPLLKTERENRAAFAAIWSGSLRLHWER